MAIVSPAQLTSLREFAGSELSDPVLRRYLVRAGGDVNRAAELLLAEKASDVTGHQPSHADAPPPATEPSALPAAAAAAEPAALKAVVKKDAWKRFYKSHLHRVRNQLGPNCTRAEVTARITDDWSRLELAEREELYAKSREALREAAAVAKAEDPVPAAAAAGEKSRPAAASPDVGPKSAVLREKTAREIEEPSAPALTASAKPAAASSSRPEVIDICDENSMSVIDLEMADRGCDAEAGGAKSSGAKSAGRGSTCDDILFVQEPEERLDPAVWPKRVASRTVSCPMTSSGRGVVRAGEKVKLVSSGKQFVRLVSSKDREIGKLQLDIGRHLGPALESGFVSAVGRVVYAPKVIPFVNGVIDVEVGVFVEKAAMQSLEEIAAARSESVLLRGNSLPKKTASKTLGSQKEATAGKKGKGKRGPPPRKGQLKSAGALLAEGEAEGIDLARISVESLLSFLGVCEPTQETSEEMAAPVSSKSGIEKFYDAGVEQAVLGEGESYEHPEPLLCSLRDYQQVAVLWMLNCEKYGGGNSSGATTALSPLWRRRNFPDGLTFYSNNTTGSMSLERPCSATSDGSLVRGGILADEMGLGKTVETLAVMIRDRMECDGLLTAGDSQRAAEISVDDTPTDILVIDSDVESSNSSGADEEAGSAPIERPTKRHKGTDSEGSVESGVMDLEKRGESGRTSSDRPVIKDQRSSDAESGSDDSRSDRTPIKDTRSSGAESGSDDSLCGQAAIKDESSSESESDDDDSDFVPEQRVARRSGPAAHSTAQRTLTQRTPAKRFLKPMTRPRIHRLRASEKTGSSKLLQGGTLLVIPMSMISQWRAELRRHVKTGFFRVVVHHEQRGAARSLSVREADVVITTYGVLATEAPEDGRNGGPLYSIEWRRLVLDEAHTIRARTSKQAAACFQLIAERRWCLSGSPVQNTVSDAQSLLRFLRVDPWSAWGYWRRGILSKIESSDKKTKAEGYATLRSVLSPITLRRMKSTLGKDGLPLVKLTERNETVVYLELEDAQRDFYDTLHDKSKRKFDTYMASGKGTSHWANVLELLLRLRQACCHPAMVIAASQKDANVKKDREAMFQKFADAGSSERSKKLEDGDQSFTCPICDGDVEDKTVLKRCGHAACRECLLGLLENSTGSCAGACPKCQAPIESKSDLSASSRSEGSRFPMTDLQKNFQSSCKLDYILSEVRRMETLRESAPDGCVGKTVVMSSFTSFIDLIGEMFDRNDITFLRFDGTLSSRKRESILKAFADDDERDESTANVLVVSTRSGNQGTRRWMIKRLLEFTELAKPVTCG